MPNFIENLTNNVKNTVLLVIQGTQKTLSTLGGFIGGGSAGSETRAPGSETTRSAGSETRITGSEANISDKQEKNFPENDPSTENNSSKTDKPSAAKPSYLFDPESSMSAALSVLNREAVEIKAQREAQLGRTEAKDAKILIDEINKILSEPLDEPRLTIQKGKPILTITLKPTGESDLQPETEPAPESEPEKPTGGKKPKV